MDLVLGVLGIGRIRIWKRVERICGKEWRRDGKSECKGREKEVQRSKERVWREKRKLLNKGIGTEKRVRTDETDGTGPRGGRASLFSSIALFQPTDSTYILPPLIRTRCSTQYHHNPTHSTPSTSDSYSSSSPFTSSRSSSLGTTCPFTAFAVAAGPLAFTVTSSASPSASSSSTSSSSSSSSPGAPAPSSLPETSSSGSSSSATSSGAVTALVLRFLVAGGALRRRSVRMTWDLVSADGGGEEIGEGKTGKEGRWYLQRPCRRLRMRLGRPHPIARSPRT